LLGNDKSSQSHSGMSVIPPPQCFKERNKSLKSYLQGFQSPPGAKRREPSSGQCSPTLPF